MYGDGVRARYTYHQLAYITHLARIKVDLGLGAAMQPHTRKVWE